MDNTIEVKNITKTFRLSRKQMALNKTSDKLKIAVNDVSFDAYPGEIYGLLGPNGAGKTTAMRCIATLIKPDTGRILIDGIDTTDDISVKRKMAFLTSDLKLEQNFTPNYLFTFFSGLYNIPSEKASLRKCELFDKFGIDKYAEVKVGELSQGMKQKLSIVISLVHDPDILVFDEPTNGLDVVTAKLVTDYLKELKNKGKTILISTHIMSLVAKLCDKVGVILDGRLIISDSPANIIATYKGDDMEEAFFNICTEYENSRRSIL